MLSSTKVPSLSRKGRIWVVLQVGEHCVGQMMSSETGRRTLTPWWTGLPQALFENIWRLHRSWLVNPLWSNVQPCDLRWRMFALRLYTKSNKISSRWKGHSAQNKTYHAVSDSLCTSGPGFTDVMEQLSHAVPVWIWHGFCLRWFLSNGCCDPVLFLPNATPSKESPVQWMRCFKNRKNRRCKFVIRSSSYDRRPLEIVNENKFSRRIGLLWREMAVFFVYCTSSSTSASF